MQIKYGCLPGIAFCNSEIFTAVFSECCGCCAPVTWGWVLRHWTELAVTISRQQWEVREHCYLDFLRGWKWKMWMMQVSEIRATALPFVWCVWHLRAAADEPTMGSGKHFPLTICYDRDNELLCKGQVNRNIMNGFCVFSKMFKHPTWSVPFLLA